MHKSDKVAPSSDSFKKVEKTEKISKKHEKKDSVKQPDEKKVVKVEEKKGDKNEGDKVAKPHWFSKDPLPKGTVAYE